MKTINKYAVQIISGLAALLVLVLAILAFTLSYSSLQHMAAGHGVEGWLSYLWPLLLDFAMIVFSLAILRASLRQESALYPWSLTATFAALATAGNVFDVTTFGVSAVIVGAIVKALAPVALVLAFELLMQMVKAEIRRSAVVQTLAELMAEFDTQQTKLTAERDRLAAELGSLNDQIDRQMSKLDDIKADILSAKSSQITDLAAARQAKIDQRRSDVLSMLQSGMTMADVEMTAADKWNVQPRTIRRDVAALNGQVR